jgi:ATP-binding cassette subfamily B protein
VGEDIDVTGAPPVVLSAGKIDFVNVDFGYEPGRQVLRDVDFHAYAGKTLAVVGGSGSGKSTIVKLLFRLYQPERGMIRIDGQDVGRVTQRSLREAIGIVPQDTVLFNETIAYNIAYGRPSATRPDVVRAARAAQLDEFIERLPDHYDTRVGERGVRLSGDERQRIAIARAILKDPRIIVFDEATSALDTRSERAIHTELTRLAQGRTSIVIAHRLSTVVDADWILVMEHGRVVEQGTHRELLSRVAVYAKMWSLQWQQGELEHAQRKLTAQPVSVAALVSGAIDALRDLMLAQRVAVHAELTDGQLHVTGDPSVLQSVLVELCRNEIMHAQPGQRIALRVDRHNNHAWVSVPGMVDKPTELSESAAQHIETTLAAAGGGFMLMPVRGRLAYVAMLPLHPLADAPPPTAPQQSPGTARLLDSLIVMAIDDQEEARDALEAVLSASGAQVRLASSGTEAIDWLSRTDTRQWPQLLLCDIVLAGEDGYDVVRRLRALEADRNLPPQHHLPIIALTGYAAKEDRLRAQQAGFDAHLSKPVSAQTLIAEVKRLTDLTSRALPTA